MPTYAIGDIQGCFSALQRLLDKIHFNEHKDTLWFVGDLVNRGPESLETLRFIKKLPNRVVVLGNHDLHLMAVYFGIRKMYADDTIEDIINAPDCEQLISWLRQQPLVHYDAQLKYAMVHAGFAPMWDLKKALTLANEVSTVLKNENVTEYLKQMYGNEPTLWQDDLKGWERLRVITNYLTRMRYCDATGHLDLQVKDLNAPPNFYPWFLVPNRKTANDNIIFGHWAALQGKADHPHVFALDTGIVWGRELTAMCLETREKFSTH